MYYSYNNISKELKKAIKKLLNENKPSKFHLSFIGFKLLSQKNFVYKHKRKENIFCDQFSLKKVQFQCK